MAGDWRISADDRTKYDSYFQQCSPIQGYVTGDQARTFFVQSGLPGDALRKIWDLSDVTADGRLDKREFAVACHLISSQVQKKAPLPSTLPPTLLADAIAIPTNGIPPVMPSIPLSITRPFNYRTAPGQPLLSGQLLKSTTISPAPLTPANRSKYLQQFHSSVDVSKTNGFMSGLIAKNILQHTNLSQTILHQIWSLADNDKDGRLTADEFVIAMHCCDIARAGHNIPARLPDAWLNTTNIPRERTDSLIKPNISPAFANLNQDMREAFQTSSSPSMNNENHSPETERRNSLVNYEDKRQKNYEDGFKELERRRQLLREQEERELREREERERRREADIQKQKDDQDRKKQMEFERQLERQRQIEQHKEEERRKLFEQRESARKELERRSRLEWERQRMQELSTQKCRLLEQINDVKSREKALGLELQSMDDTIQTGHSKHSQSNSTIHTIDQSIVEIEKRTNQERSLLDNLEQQRKDIMSKLSRVQAEKESISSSFQHLNQSKEFNMGNREPDQLRFMQVQLETIKQESGHVDEQITRMNNQCKQYQNQMEQLRRQLNQLEQDARTKKTSSKVTSPSTFATYDQFHDSNARITSSFPGASPAALDVDPFQTVDPFASESDIGSPTTLANADWFQPSMNGSTTNDPFPGKTNISPKNTKTISRGNSKPQAPAVDPWNGSATNNNGNSWASFSGTSTANDWPQPPSTTSSGKSTNGSNGLAQYRALYDYAPERSDEMSMTVGDIITVDPTQQQDENWLFGKIGNDKQGFFPTAYAEAIPTTPSSADTNAVNTSSQLSSGSWAVTLAECQGKTSDKHLSFQKGEMILVREQKDATWYSGHLRGKVGWFPRSYVRPATDVEIQNNKNTTNNAPITPSSLNSPSSPNDNSIADIYKAIYPYEATDSGDLSFNVGDEIIVLKQEGDWWTGKIGDRIGTFPNNYVQKLDNPLQEMAIAIQPFRTTDVDRLSFDQGQTIYIRKKSDKGWYQGEIRHPDQPIRVGWFPAYCVQLQSVSSPTTSGPSYLNTSGPSYLNTSEFPRFVAIFPYDAQQDDELTFPADALLEIIEDAGNSGWFKARYNNRTGLVPSTYLRPIGEHLS